MPKAKRRATQHRVRRATRPAPPTAIVRVAAPTERPWELNNEQVVLLKNYLKIADASEIELKGCLEVARRYKIDPFKQGQIWFIKRWDKNAASVTGSKGAYVFTPQVGIYGMLHIAARDYRDFGSVSEPEFGPMFTHDVEGHKFKAPEWCRVKVFKKGIAEPTSALIYFDEFCPSLWDNARLFWAKMPRAMLEKCAKARAIRTAYPDLGGLYIPEEMDRMSDNATNGGRQIVQVPSTGSREASQRVAEEKLSGARPLHPQEPAVAPQPPQESHGEPPSEAPSVPRAQIPQTAFKGTVQIDYSNETWPIIRGDLSDISPLLKEACPTMDWGKDEAWHVQPRDLERLKQTVAGLGYAIEEKMPQRDSGPKDAGSKGKPATAATGKSTTPAGAGAAKSKSAGTPSAEPTVVKGFIQKITVGMTSRNAPTRQVKMENVWYTCYRNTLHDFLDKAGGKEVELYVDAKHTVVGLKRIGATEFDTDGVTPTIQRNREAGGKTLF